MGDRGFNILSVLCLAAIVGVMSWRSMHPHVSGVRATQVSYYAGDGITPANIPADNSPITIGAGTFSTTADGGTSWTP
ncbi:MAG: hypothetical protein KGQ70_03085, partial [Alphaproteobacteria bacterium]|nr:hypothetical protein [Alphaproteobacteria bacterium]